jgi:hypothetical protein
MNGRRITRIDELAQSIPPPRDLWPAISKEISAAIEAEKSASAPEAKRTLRRAAWMPAVGLAASVALVTVGVFIGRGIAPPQGVITSGTGTSTGLPSDPAAGREDVRQIKYEKQRTALIQQVNAKLQSMPKAERDKVAASLATLDRSIKEIKAALGRDPGNALLQELFVNSCQEEMRALTAVRDSGREEI